MRMVCMRTVRWCGTIIQANSEEKAGNCLDPAF